MFCVVFQLTLIESNSIEKYSHAVVSINQLTINSNQFTLILVSRRSVQRAGTRLFSRGIDRNVCRKCAFCCSAFPLTLCAFSFFQGYCSNFVETEQIVEFAGDRASFVQTRGSIPLFWAQSPNLQYKPKPLIDSRKDHMNLAAASKHFDTQMQLYGRQVLVNLVRPILKPHRFVSFSISVQSIIRLTIVVPKAVSKPVSPISLPR